MGRCSRPGVLVGGFAVIEGCLAVLVGWLIARVAADPLRAAIDIETADLELIAAVRASVTIPLAVKLSPYYSSLANFAAAATRAGADGLVLFNRFYQPDIDLTRLQVLADLNLSGANEIRLPLLWLAVLAGRVKASLAATTGVNSADEVVKYLLVGWCHTFLLGYALVFAALLGFTH